VHHEIIELFKNRRIRSDTVEKLVRSHIEEALEPFLKAMEELEEANT